MWDNSREDWILKKDENGVWQVEPLGQHRDWTWPETPSIDAFYQITALLCDTNETNDITSDSMIHDMKKALHDYVEDQKTSLSDISDRDEEYVVLDDIIKVFNSSCALLMKEREDNTIYDPQETQAWMDEQDVIWAKVKAQTKAFYMPICVGKSPLGVMNSIDKLSSLWQAHQDAIHAGGMAQATATTLLS